MIFIIAAVHFILVSGADHQRLALNIAEISSIREMREAEKSQFDPDVQCVVVMTNGKLIGTVDPCTSIIDKIYEAE